MVASSAFNGAVSKNPFNFAHMKCRSVDLTLDGNSVMPGPFHTDYEKNLYVEAFLSMFERGQMEREAFAGGFALYKFTLGQLNTDDSVAPACSGHMRLTIHLADPLSEPVTVFIYGK